jgi:hypothetical protein
VAEILGPAMKKNGGKKEEKITDTKIFGTSR